MNQVDDLSLEQPDFSGFLKEVQDSNFSKDKNYLILLSEHQPLFFNFLKQKINANVLDVALDEDGLSHSSNILSSLIFDKNKQVYLVDLFENKKEKLEFIKQNKNKCFIVFSPIKIDDFEALNASSNLTKTLFKNIIHFFDLKISNDKLDPFFKIFEKNKSFNLDDIFNFSQQLTLVSSSFLNEFLYLVEQTILRKNIFSLTDSILRQDSKNFFQHWFDFQDSFTEQFWNNFFQNFIWKSLSGNFKLDSFKRKKMLNLCERLYVSDFFSKNFGASNNYIFIFSDFFFDL